MNIVKVLIADDELPARDGLKYILEQIPEVAVTGECANGQEAVDFLKDGGQADMVFLDIEMPVMTGLEAAAAIHAMERDVKIVFSTGFSQFAVQAFELEAFDYILKPYRDERIESTVRRFAEARREKETKSVGGEVIFPRKKLAVHSADKILLLNPSEIAMVKTEKGKGSLFYTDRGIIESKILLKDAEKILGANGFCRTHKSYVVNLDKIKEMIPWFNDTYLLVMEQFEKEQIPVSRHYLPLFKKLMALP